jgi:hypothetical protein
VILFIIEGSSKLKVLAEYLFFVWGGYMHKREFPHNEIENAIQKIDGNLWGELSEELEVLILDIREKGMCRYIPPIPKHSPGPLVYFPTDLETGEPHWKKAKDILRVKI